MKPFSCIVPKIVFGAGELKTLGAAVRERGVNAFLALDSFLDTAGLGTRIEGLLKEAGVSVIKYTDFSPDPDCREVDAAVKDLKNLSVDVIIAVGGGSALDFGKGVAVMAKNSGNCWEYTRRRDHTAKIPTEETLPIIAVPTTAGTGSETTHFAVFVNTAIKEKSTIVSEKIFPKTAIVDPELTVTCPPRLTALTGIDALAHAIEAYINKNSSPFARMVSLESIRHIGRYLKRAVDHGDDMEAREGMSWASTLSGIAIAHANPTLPHALGQAAGGFVHAPHGASVAACLPYIMEISGESSPERFADIAEALDSSTRYGAMYEKAGLASSLVKKLFEDVDVRVTLSDLGIKKEDIPRITQIALNGYFTGISLHPKEVDAADIEKIYLACL